MRRKEKARKEKKPVDWTYPILFRQDASKVGGNSVYLNCSYRGNDPYGTLSKDMTCPDYSKMHDPVLRDAVRQGKIMKKEDVDMSDLAKELVELGKEIGTEDSKKEIALKLLKMGCMAPAEIAEITGLPLETVLSLKE